MKHYNPTRIDPVVQGKKVSLQLVEYDQLRGGLDPAAAERLYFSSQTGMRLRQICVKLSGGTMVLEAGALHFMSGDITVENRAGGAGGFLAKLLTSSLTGEGAFNPRYTGTGDVFLEPSFGHFLVLELENEAIVCDKGMFVAAEGTVTVSVAIQERMSSALFGGEGLFQTLLVGTGLVVLASPVPFDEIAQVPVTPATPLKVDGPFALLRTGDVTFSMERSAKSIFGTLASGEGLLQTFRGTGEVWLAPTLRGYEALAGVGVRAAGPSATKPSGCLGCLGPLILIGVALALMGMGFLLAMSVQQG